jgi:hypothetical protein
VGPSLPGYPSRGFKRNREQVTEDIEQEYQNPFTLSLVTVLLPFQVYFSVPVSPSIPASMFFFPSKSTFLYQFPFPSLLQSPFP